MESSLIDVNIYCDESRYSNNEDPYLVIGAVKCLRDKKPEIANALIKMKRAYGIGGEFGWKTASRNKEDFYRAVLSWFINCGDVLFRCVVANKRHLWSRDDEGGFYIVYNQLLCHCFPRVIPIVCSLTERRTRIDDESMSYGIKQCAIRPWSVPSRAWKKLNRTNAFSSSLQIC